jgi:hypothetical protein
VTPNASLRNEELPTRRPDGSLARRPQAALDLSYLLTFYGDESTLEPQRLLGTAVSTLNARPVLVRDAIRDAIEHAVDEDPLTYLQFADLQDQVDMVKLSPVPLNLEELSKLWSVFFQTPYALSVAYQATVVLVESAVTPRDAPPVRARGLYLTPLRSPFIERVRPPRAPTSRSRRGRRSSSRARAWTPTRSRSASAARRSPQPPPR